MKIRLIRYFDPLTAAALGIGSSVAQGAANLVFGGMAQKQQLAGRQKSLNQDYDYWLKTNYEAQKGQMKKAGLNPGLMYGMGGGGGGQSASGAMPEAASNRGMDIAQNAQLALMKAQKENIEADTENKRKDAGKKSAETPGAEARSTMDSQEAKSREGWTSVMSKTFGDEQEARQAIAGTIGEMWKDGKLREGAEADLKAKLLANAKSDAEKREVEKGIEKIGVDIRSGELNNEILELEKDLQKDLGIDKSAPTFLKIVGRLFLKYFK